MGEAQLFEGALPERTDAPPRVYRIITQEADGLGYSSLMTLEQASEWASELARDGVVVLRIERDEE